VADTRTSVDGPRAAEIGRLGGEARANALSPTRRSEIARQAARSRWAGAAGALQTAERREARRRARRVAVELLEALEAVVGAVDASRNAGRQIRRAACDARTVIALAKAKGG
jgi:hypothetical protein